MLAKREMVASSGFFALSKDVVAASLICCPSVRRNDYRLISSFFGIFCANRLP